MAKRSDRLRSRHVLTNILIDVVNADHARGVTYLSLYRHISDVPDGQPIDRTIPAAIGQYDDEFVRGENGFRISRRVLTLAFRDPSAFPTG
jgi:SnoaL-like domain